MATPPGSSALADSYADRRPDGHYTNLFDANAAVNCADDPVRSSLEQVRDLQAQWRDKYPLFGGAAGGQAC